MPQLPEWLNSTVRQIVAAIGVILAALDLVEASIFDQIAPALVSIVLIAYDVLRTKDLEDDLDALIESNEILVAANDTTSQTVTKLSNENAKLAAELTTVKTAVGAAAKPATKAKTTEA